MLVGFTGLMSMAHAAFYGFGAYSCALLMMRLNLGFLSALSITAVLALVVSLLVALPSLRLKGDYFLLASLAFQYLALNVMKNMDGLTGGPLGLPGIPKPSLFGLKVDTSVGIALYYGVLVACIITATIMMLKSKFGLFLRAIRDDESVALSIGINTFSQKVAALAISCTLAAVAGGMFASYYTFVDPTSFGLGESIFILSAVLVGGSGNIRGPLIGASFMVLLPELLRFLQIPSEVSANARQIIYGGLLILLMRYRPQGIAGEYPLDK